MAWGRVRATEMVMLAGRIVVYFRLWLVHIAGVIGITRSTVTG